MKELLYVKNSPGGERSKSAQIAENFPKAYRLARADAALSEHI